MFNLFKRKRTVNRETILIPYNSTYFLDLLKNKINGFLCNEFNYPINFTLTDYDYSCEYSYNFDCPCIEKSHFDINSSITELDQIANKIIHSWQDDDSAEILAEDIYKSCLETNSYNVNFSFAFTNYCPNFEMPGLIIFWSVS